MLLTTFYLKSVNLQYITLGCLDDGTNESSTKRLMFQVIHFFFKISCKILFAKILSIYFLIFYKITKIKIKSFECPKYVSIKKNTWNIRHHQVDESFVPSSKQPSVIYCRLTDFMLAHHRTLWWEISGFCILSFCQNERI